MWIKKGICILTGLITVFILISFNSMSFANDNKYTRVSLKGIEGFQLKVKTSPSLEREGLLKSKIQTLVASKLQETSLKSLNPQERSQTPGRPIFNIKIIGSKIPKPPIFVYTINIAVYQDVVLKRDSNTIISAATWSKNLSGESSSLQDIYDLTEIVMNMFKKSFESVNSK